MEVEKSFTSNFAIPFQRFDFIDIQEEIAPFRDFFPPETGKFYCPAAGATMGQRKEELSIPISRPATAGSLLTVCEYGSIRETDRNRF